MWGGGKGVQVVEGGEPVGGPGKPGREKVRTEGLKGEAGTELNWARPVGTIRRKKQGSRQRKEGQKKPECNGLKHFLVTKIRTDEKCVRIYLKMCRVTGFRTNRKRLKRTLYARLLSHQWEKKAGKNHR